MGGTGVGSKDARAPFEGFQNALPGLDRARGSRRDRLRLVAHALDVPVHLQEVGIGDAGPEATFSAPDWSLIGPVKTS